MDLEGVDGMLSGGSSGRESEREKVRLNCEHPRHVTVASPGIPGPSPPRYQIPLFFRERDYHPGWDGKSKSIDYNVFVLIILCATVIYTEVP